MLKKLWKQACIIVKAWALMKKRMFSGKKSATMFIVDLIHLEAIIVSTT